MPTVQLQFSPTVVKNIDGSLLDVEHELLFDGFFDQKRNYRGRPGLGGSLNFTSDSYSPPIDGLFYWPGSNPDQVVMVSGKWVTLLSVYPTGLAAAGSNDISTVAPLGIAFIPGVRPTFASDGTNVYFANGGKICRVNSAGDLAVIDDADAPTSVTHVAWLDGYLLANEVGTGRVWFSERNAATDWQGELFQAAGNPDDALAVKVVNREIFIFGRVSTEIWENDGETPFSRVPGGFIEAGCIAPYSVVAEDQELMWLDDKRRFVRWQGGALQHISSDFDSEIAHFDSVSDCVGDLVTFDGFTFYVFNFPSANRTIVYSKATNSWIEWGYWDSASGEYQRMLVSSFAQVPGPGKLVCGSRVMAKVYLMDRNYYTDDGSTLRFSVRSPHVDYGTLRNKRSRRLFLRARRGEGGSSNPVLMLRWRNNNSPQWSNWRHLPLGNIGQTEHVLKLGPTGIYRTRQYEIAVTDGVPVEFGKIEEDVELLG